MAEHLGWLWRYCWWPPPSAICSRCAFATVHHGPFNGLRVSNRVATDKNYSSGRPNMPTMNSGNSWIIPTTTLGQIESQDKALREAQAELERRVGERTRELFGANQQLHQ